MAVVAFDSVLCRKHKTNFRHKNIHGLIMRFDLFMSGGGKIPYTRFITFRFELSNVAAFMWRDLHVPLIYLYCFQ